MNIRKIGSLLAYITSEIPNVSLKKLIKLVYLIDEKSVYTRSLSMTWMTYFVWEKGPVAPCIYDIKNSKESLFSDYVMAKRNELDKVEVLPLLTKEQAALRFSKNELALIDAVLKECGAMNADQLSDVTHTNGSLWSLANKKYNPNFTALKGKTDITIDLRELIANNEEKLDVYDDAYEVAML